MIDAPYRSTTPRPYALADWQAGTPPPHGWDVGDCLEDGWSRADVTQLMREAVSNTLPPWPEAEPADKEERETMRQDLDDGLTDLQARVGVSHEANTLAPASKPNAISNAATSAPVDPLRALITGWCFLTARGVFRNLMTGDEAKVQAFNLAHQAVIPEVDHTVAGRVLKAPKIVSAADYLLGYAGGSQAADTMYLPGTPDRFVTVDGVRYLNSYLPEHVPSAAPKWTGHWAVETWETHLRKLLPDDWRLLRSWLAYCVQNPGHKILWAPIIKGTQGDGKSSVGQMLGRVMGRRNVKVVSTESLFSDFTGYAEGACVAFLEEIRVKGHNRHDAMNKLKPLVTNDVVEVVRKGENGRNIPNVTNYMAFTNFEDALVLDENDRRWGVFFTPFENRAQVIAAGMDDAYFDKLHSALAHESVLRGWLLSIDLSDFNPKSAPPTTAGKKAMISASVSPDAAMLAELVSLGRFGVASNAAATDCVNAALKVDYGVQLIATRMATAFAEIGWRKSPFQLKWRGKPRYVYVRPEYPWPTGEAEIRILMREMLDETDGAEGRRASPERVAEW